MIKCWTPFSENDASFTIIRILRIAKPLFFGESTIQSQEGCQQGDPEGPALFSDTIQDLLNQIVSQFNIWYLDDGNLSDHYRTVLEDLKLIIASSDEYGLSLEKAKCYLIFLGNCSASQKKKIKALFEEVCRVSRLKNEKIWKF